MELVTCQFLLRNYETHNEESPWHFLFMAVPLLFWYLQSTLWYFQHCQWWCVFSLFQMTPLLWAPALSCCLIFVQGVQLVCCYMLVIPAGARATISVCTCSEERWGLTLCHLNEATSVVVVFLAKYFELSFWKTKTHLNWARIEKTHLLVYLTLS